MGERDEEREGRFASRGQGAPYGQRAQGEFGERDQGSSGQGRYSQEGRYPQEMNRYGQYGQQSGQQYGQQYGQQEGERFGRFDDRSRLGGDIGRSFDEDFRSREWQQRPFGGQSYSGQQSFSGQGYGSQNWGSEPRSQFGQFGGGYGGGEGRDRYSHQGQSHMGDRFLQGQGGYGQGGSSQGYMGGREGRSQGDWYQDFGAGGGHERGQGRRDFQDDRSVGDQIRGTAGRLMERGEQLIERVGEGARNMVGNLVGRGPKGYTRSDTRIKEEVSDLLTDHPDIDASDIEIQVKDGEVTLAGSVTERRSKLLAEHVVDRIRGVRDVHNQIRLKRDQTQQMTGIGTSAQASGTMMGNQTASRNSPEQATRGTS